MLKIRQFVEMVSGQDVVADDGDLFGCVTPLL
jgi:hypothetical protein